MSYPQPRGASAWLQNQDGAVEYRSAGGRLIGAVWKNASGWHQCSWLDDGLWGWIKPPAKDKREAMWVVAKWVCR